MKEPPRPLSDKLKIETYARDAMVEFHLRSSPASAPIDDTVVLVPLSIVFRLYHLGRAYDLTELIRMHPTGSTSFAYFSMQHLVDELEQVSAMLSDEVVRHYVTLLAVAVRTAARERTANLFVRVP